jgi:hypothetical protein
MTGGTKWRRKKGPAAIGLGATGWYPRDRDPNLYVYLHHPDILKIKIKDDCVNGPCSVRLHFYRRRIILN